MNKRKPNWLDMLAYRWFYRRWTPLLIARPDLRQLFREWLDEWEQEQGVRCVRLVDGGRMEPLPLSDYQLEQMREDAPEN